MAKVILGEAQDILKILPIEQLKMFSKMRLDKSWPTLCQFFKDQKNIKMDKIYRLRRPKNQDDMVSNAIEHEYYAGRISEGVVFLQICENASDEIERRERKQK